MSKKAKLNRAISRRETRIEKLDTALRWSNNERDKLKDQIASLEAKVCTLEKQAEQREETTNRAVTNNQGLRDSVGKLKVLVADLQATTAEQWGIIKALERQIVQAAPKVMIRPPVMASPAEASRSNSQPSRSFESDIIRATAPSGQDDRRHWTAL